MKKKIAATRGTTNVFADLKYVNPEEMLAKAQLVSRISDLIKQRRLTQSDAAALLGIDQPNVSRLLRGQLGGFSYERLLKFLSALGWDVEIVVKRSGRARRHTHEEDRAREAPGCWHVIERFDYFMSCISFFILAWAVWHSALDRYSQPLPLQLFCPLQALVAL